MKIFRYLSYLVFSLCLLFASSAYAFPPAFSSSTATQFDALTDVAGEGTIHYVLTDDGDGSYTMKLLTEDNLAATLNLAGKTITFGLEASDIPDLSGTYQPLQAYLTDIAALSMVAGDILYFDGTHIAKLGEGANNEYVLAINTATHAPYWKADATGAGGDQLVDVVTTAPITINGTTHVDNIEVWDGMPTAEETAKSISGCGLSGCSLGGD